MDLLLIHNPCTLISEYKAAQLPHFFELENYYDGPSKITPAKFPEGDDIRPVITEKRLQ